MNERQRSEKCHWQGQNGILRQQVWWAAVPGLTDEKVRIGHDGYCPTCGVHLRADGTEQARCDAVPAEAVRGTHFFKALQDQVDHPPVPPDKWGYRGSRILGSEIQIIHAAITGTLAGDDTRMVTNHCPVCEGNAKDTERLAARWASLCSGIDELGWDDVGREATKWGLSLDEVADALQHIVIDGGTWATFFDHVQCEQPADAIIAQQPEEERGD